jgi:ABC-2 type transport system permease protein
LPIWPPAPLVGALLGDAVRYALAAAVTIAVALALGFRPESPLGVIAGVGLLVVFAFGLSWVFTTIGLVMRNPNAVMNTGFMGLFPLLFLSNAFVDPSTMPGWLEAFVDVNPFSFLISALRGLMEGSVAGGDIAVVLGTALVLTAIFAPLTTRLYRTRG